MDSEREGPSSPISGPVMSSYFAPSVEPKEKLVKRSSTLGELRALEFALVAFGPSLYGEREQFEFECSAPVSALSKRVVTKAIVLGCDTEVPGPPVAVPSHPLFQVGAARQEPCG